MERRKGSKEGRRREGARKEKEEVPSLEEAVPFKGISACTTHCRGLA